MLKRTLALFVVAFFAIALISGCGKKEEVKKVDEKKVDTVKQQQTEQKKDTVKTEKKDTVATKEIKDVGGDFVKMVTTMGTIKIKLFPDKAPKTVARIKELIGKGFYDGLIFHRVIDGFMIQGGDPTGTGTGGSGQPIPDEFGNGLKHDKKGVVAMAHSAAPNSQDSQFYITLAPAPHLDGKYTVFGVVVDGQDVVDKIGKVKTGPNDKPVETVKMTKVTLEKK
jgi:cyclophilin family peptidyl-prolyl cis-trans isomerase